MNRFLFAVLVSVPVLSLAAGTTQTPRYYAVGLCDNPKFQCIKVEGNQSWEKLFPDEQERDIVQRVNRNYNNLWSGKVIAVPRQLKGANLLDFAPFPKTINADHEKQIIIDQNLLAWGAYDPDGKLVYWGPIASGSSKCSDSNKACLTMTGVFRVFSKEDDTCKSDVYPIGKGGAKMPYCMYFHKGFAMHGSSDMPGYRASHGCIRMFIRDAKWLNHEFVESTNESKNVLGTRVVVRPVQVSEIKS